MRLALFLPGGVDRAESHRVIPVFMALIERLARTHEVHVVTLSQYPRPYVYTTVGATVYDLGWPRKLRVGAVLRSPMLYGSWRRALGQLRASGRFDAVHGFWAGLSGALAVRAARALGAPLVVSLCGGELVALPEIRYGGQQSWRGRAVVARTLRAADRVTAATTYMTDLARQQEITAQHIPLGIPTSAFRPPPAPPGGPPWRLIHVASLNRVKDQSTLLRAFRAVVDADDRVQLDIVGSDTLGGVVQAHCAELSLGGHLAFHGYLPNEQLAGLYQAAHLFVMSSRHEAAMVAALEAAACGVPTVGTAVGHVAD